MLTDAEPLRDLRNGIASLGNLRDRVTLEIIAEMTRPHHGLLASKLGKKASTNLGAIQTKPAASGHARRRGAELAPEAIDQAGANRP